MFDTPGLIINVNQMEKNINKMADTIHQYGVSLRPHTKTHKMPEIAQKQIAAGAHGITTAKVSEAEVMAEQGIDDIFIAYPIVTPAKLERVIELSRKINLIIGVDSYQGAVNISKLAQQHNQLVQVRLEVDTGLRRTGVLYESAVQLAQQIQQMRGLQFRGIYTYRGSFMNGKSTLERQQAGLEEGQMMVEMAERIRSKGIEVRDISVGSTPTAVYAAQVKGITEVRPGTYVFYDHMQVVMKSCTLEEVAASVRVTVVSRPSVELMIIDGGSKTFATDVPPYTAPLHLKGFGYIVEAPHAIIERFSEEHGMVQIKESDSFQVGDTVHVIPNHICSTVNLHNQVYFEQENGLLEERIVSARGRLT